MCFKRKDKPIKLGQLNTETGKLEKYSQSITWDLDYTIINFIIGSLKEFKKVKNGYPAFLEKDYPNEEDAIAYYDKIIQSIIEDFEYYMQYSRNFLPKEDKKYLDNYLNDMKAENGKITFPPKDEKICRIYDNLHVIEKDQEMRRKRAFEMLNEWLPTFWW